MANKYKGVGKLVQIGNEETYGTLGTMDMSLNYLSENMKLDVKKTTEESLLATKTVNAVNINGYDVSGDITLNLKPENLSIFKYAFKEAAAPTLVTTGVYKHTLTLLGPTDEQTPFSMTIDRGAKVVAYTGLVIDSLAFQGDVRSPISLKLGLKGHSEVDGTIDAELDAPALDSFNALNGIASIGGSVVSDVTSASIEIKQALDDGTPTYGSGLYNNKPLHGLKEVNTKFDGFYNSATSTIRESDYKGNAYISQVITWVSPSEIASGNPYKIVFTMPKVVINDASPTISGKDTIKISLGGLATGNGGNEPLTIEIWDSVSTKY